MEKNEIIALMQIINDNGELYASFGVSKLSQALNSIRGQSTQKQRFVLLSSNNGIVAVTEDAKRVIVLQTYDELDEAQ